jgi:hypothetical protein
MSFDFRIDYTMSRLFPVRLLIGISVPESAPSAPLGGLFPHNPCLVTLLKFIMDTPLNFTKKYCHFTF